MKTVREIIENRGEIRAYEDETAVGKITFLIEHGKIIVDHTYTFEGHEGKGVGKVLMAAVVEYAKEQGVELQATCSYAQHYIEKYC